MGYGSPNGGGALTGTALAILLELEVVAALAAVLGRRELHALMLAAAVAPGTGGDGWGHTDRSSVGPGG